MAKKKPAAEKPADKAAAPPVEENNRCFIITPIGDDSSEVRRATDGLIDAVIEPVLDEYGIDIEVAHRSFDPRSITGRIVEHVVESKLVIVNLTDLNPNVMYELAIRHAAGKPVITIAERGTSLPFDVSNELTFFYDNDMRGVVELKRILGRAIVSALNAVEIDNPVVRYQQDALIKVEGEAPDATRLVLDRLGQLESAIRSGRSKSVTRGVESDSGKIMLVRIQGDGAGDWFDKNLGYILTASLSKDRRLLDLYRAADDLVLLLASVPEDLQENLLERWVYGDIREVGGPRLSVKASVWESTTSNRWRRLAIALQNSNSAATSS